MIIIIIIIIITHTCTVIQEIQKYWGEKLGGLEIHSSGSCQWGGYGSISCFGCTAIMLAMVSLEFFIDIILPAALRPWG